jgi:HEAT repeat protein
MNFGVREQRGGVLEHLTSLLARLDGPGIRSPEDRERAVAELRALERESLFRSLAKLLSQPDTDIHCNACLAAVLTDQASGIDLVLPLLKDRDSDVRWHVCGLLHDFGDHRAIQPLIERLHADPDPLVRGTAAYALGGIGDPSAIPALQAAELEDHEVDPQGFTPSYSAKQALEEISRGAQR